MACAAMESTCEHRCSVCVQLLVVVDMVLNLITHYLDKAKVWVTSIRHIMMNYLSGWFLWMFWPSPHASRNNPLQYSALVLSYACCK
jgi:hypothetical protein